MRKRKKLTKTQMRMVVFQADSPRFLYYICFQRLVGLCRRSSMYVKSALHITSFFSSYRPSGAHCYPRMKVAKQILQLDL